MKRIAATALAALLLVSLTGPAARAEGEKSPILRVLRASPSYGSKIITQLDTDANLDVIRTENIAGVNWDYVTTEAGLMGWVDEQWVDEQFLPVQEPTAEANLTLRSSPSTGGRIITVLDADADLEVLRTENVGGVAWSYVSVEGGNVLGWVILPEQEAQAEPVQEPTEAVKLIIRSAPANSSRILAELDADTKLDVLKTEAIAGVSWAYVSTANVIGWVEEDLLPASAEAWVACTIRATSIRRTPAPEGTEVFQLDEGVEVKVEEPTSGWARVTANLYDGTLSVTGWVDAMDLNFYQSSQPKNMILYAEPSENSTIVAEKSITSSFAVGGVESVEGKTWVRIVMKGSVEGWVEADVIGYAPVPAETDVIEYAAAPAEDESIEVPLEGIRALAAGEGVVIRSSPSDGARFITQSSENTELTILRLERIGGLLWAYVDLEEESVMGWARASQLVLPDGASVNGSAAIGAEVIYPKPEGEPQTTEMLLEDLNLYSSPSLSDSVIARLEKETRVGVVLRKAFGDQVWAYVQEDSQNVAGWIKAEQIVGTVANTNGGRVNVRSGPGTLYEVVGIYDFGTDVRILELSGDWARTETGWVHRNYLEESTVSTLVDTANIRTGVVTNPTLNIRSNPGSDSNFLGMYQKDDAITIVETHDGWGRTDLGWVNLEHVALEEP